MQTTGIAEVSSCSRDGDRACMFMDPRAAHASLLATDGRLRRCPALRAMQVVHRSGAFVIFDGFYCADVSDLNTISAQEAEIWLPFAKCFLYFSSADPAAIRAALREPLPITMQHVFRGVLEALATVAEEVH